MNIFLTSMWLPAIAKLYISTIMSLRTDAAIIGHICVDCELAAKFACGERKANYVMRFGLAPHFKAHINSAVNRCSAYIHLFDESYNAMTKNKQMDIFIRYWTSEERVGSRYIQSMFPLSRQSTGCVRALPGRRRQPGAEACSPGLHGWSQCQLGLPQAAAVQHAA